MRLTIEEIDRMREMMAVARNDGSRPGSIDVPPVSHDVQPTRNRVKRDLPDGYLPSVQEIERYLAGWDGLDDYVDKEEALKLLFRTHPDFTGNTSLTPVLVKCSVLNDFYSTNIFRIHEVALKIVGIPDFDSRLDSGDPELVGEVAEVNGRVNYSFATKYCSHHRPMLYPIYDRYVGDVLKALKRRRPGEFADFQSSDLKSYPRFRVWIDRFMEVYGLTDYSYKDIDRYLWQLGKEYFNPYNTNNK